MLTEPQFEKLIEAIIINQSDRERLIRMETMLEMISKNETQCRTDMVCRIESAKSAVLKAHERIDNEERARLRVVSIFSGIIGFSALVIFILKLTGHM